MNVMSKIKQQQQQQQLRQQQQQQQQKRGRPRLHSTVTRKSYFRFCYVVQSIVSKLQYAMRNMSWSRERKTRLCTYRYLLSLQ